MTTKDNKFKLPRRYEKCAKNVWEEITELVGRYNPLNLGIGFPDYPPSEYVTSILSHIATNENSEIHQYTRDFGHLRLVNVLAKLYSKLLDREIDPQKEVLTMASGCQALFATISGLVDNGDEVIILEPYFDFYESLVNIAGGICRFVPLRLQKESRDDSPLSSCEWSINTEELENAFNEKTKIFILNTPNNPLGKVFTLKELTIIANLCKKWNVVCIADEVYEFFVYAPNEHIRMASLPNMWERTITICCPGKTFEVTGWELGIAYGPENLIFNLQIVHQNLVYTSTTPTQEAFAILFEKELDRFDEDDCVFSSLSKKIEKKRNFMMNTLTEAGMKPVIPEGGFLILADWRPIASKFVLNSESDEPKDFQLTKWMITNIGLAAIPMSAFYSQHNKQLGENYIRFCFLKKYETLERFSLILKKWLVNV